MVIVEGECAHFCEGWGQDFHSGRLEASETNDLLTYCCIDAAHMKECLIALRHFMFVPYGPDQAYLITLDNINKDNQIHTNLPLLRISIFIWTVSVWLGAVSASGS